MLSKSMTKKLADLIVNYSMKIGQKENPAYAKARKKYRWLAGSFTLVQAVKRSGLSKKKVEEILKKYSDVDYGPLIIKKGSKYHVKTKVGHNVVVSHNPATKELKEYVERACWKNGAHVASREMTARDLSDYFRIAPLDTLHELPPMSRATREHVDYRIYLEAIEKEFWAKGIPVARLMAGAPATQKVHEIEDRKKTRWVLVGWPHPETAKELGISPSKFKKIMFDSIWCSFDKKTINMINRYHRKFDGSHTIRITANDRTDLTFSVKGRRFLKDDGVLSDEDIKNNDVGMNIPCGEIFTAPVENSANGTLYYPKTMVRDHGMVHGLMLYFKNGRVVKFTAKKGREHLVKFFKENIGEKDRIAEFGIGMNRNAKYTEGNILIDEKIFKTIHIAIGWNIGYGGKNQASSHLDFIKPLHNCNGRVYADGKILINKGVLVA
jgi:aminopeptidase